MQLVMTDRASVQRSLDIISGIRERGFKHCSISRPEQPIVGATATTVGEVVAESTGADSAPAAASSDDDGGGDADPDGRRPRKSAHHTPTPYLARASSAHSKPARLLRLPELKTRCGLGRSTIYQRIKEGSFPPAISLGARTVAWLETDIDRWIADQIQSSQALA